MPSDIVLASELKSLQEEVAAARRERQPALRPDVQRPAGEAMTSVDAAIANAPPEAGEEAQARYEQLGELAEQVTQFFEGAGKNIAAHPAESVIAALFLGMLIGRLLGRG